MAVLSKVANIAVQPQPVGVVEAFAGSNAPNGWLICDGSQVSRALYPELFSVIGTTYGSGDGFTTFTLPDLRGRTIAGRDGVNNMNNGPVNRLTSTHFGASGTALGNSGGNEAHTLSTTQMPSHSHTNNSSSANGGYGLIRVSPGGNNTTDGILDTSPGEPDQVTRPAAVTINNTGGDGAHNNTQPTIILNYIIKAVSELPRGGWYNSSSPDVVTSLPTNPYVGQEVYHQINGDLFFKRYNGTTWQNPKLQAEWAAKEGPTSWSSGYKVVWNTSMGTGSYLSPSAYNYGILVNITAIYEVWAAQRCNGGGDFFIGLGVDGNRSTLEDRSTGMWGHDHSPDSSQWSHSYYLGQLNAGEIITSGSPSNPNNGLYGASGLFGHITIKLVGTM